MSQALIGLVRRGFAAAGAETPRVLVVGDLMLDRYLWGDVERISPEAPVPVVRLTRESDRVGGAGNVAANLVGLGLETAL
nr:bifunctional heptose 7-phosphate kinase/heptose 1-phosphate adenyltransferase [Candidatus Contendobacter sp.]